MDMPTPTPRTILVVPHCDDELLACGISLLRDPRAFWLIVAVSHGGTSEELPHVQGDALAIWREEETLEFLRRVGCPHYPRFLRLGYPGELDNLAASRLAWNVTDLVRQGGFRRIISPHWEDRHPDHQFCGKVVRGLATSGGPLAGLEDWRYANSIVAAKTITEKYGPPTHANPRDCEYAADRTELVTVYQSQKHFLPGHLSNSWFNTEKFWEV
jgi:LmbE family N-acetylglucosaminyl deacetylase